MQSGFLLSVSFHRLSGWLSDPCRLWCWFHAGGWKRCPLWFGGRHGAEAVNVSAVACAILHKTQYHLWSAPIPLPTRFAHRVLFGAFYINLLSFLYMPLGRQIPCRLSNR